MNKEIIKRIGKFIVESIIIILLLCVTGIMGTIFYGIIYATIKTYTWNAIFILPGYIVTGALIMIFIVWVDSKVRGKINE
jgi:hypothetical protein